MVIGDAVVVDARDVGVPQVRDQLVFAQEAVERRAAFDDVRDLAEDLEHALLAGARVAREVDARGPADGQPTDALIAADVHRAESVGWHL